MGTVSFPQMQNILAFWPDYLGKSWQQLKRRLRIAHGRESDG
jgi:hypothetical protein